MAGPGEAEAKPVETAAVTLAEVRPPCLPLELSFSPPSRTGISRVGAGASSREARCPRGECRD